MAAGKNCGLEILRVVNPVVSDILALLAHFKAIQPDPELPGTDIVQHESYGGPALQVRFSRGSFEVLI